MSATLASPATLRVVNVDVATLELQTNCDIAYILVTNPILVDNWFRFQLPPLPQWSAAPPFSPKTSMSSCAVRTPVVQLVEACP